MEVKTYVKCSFLTKESSHDAPMDISVLPMMFILQAKGTFQADHFPIIMVTFSSTAISHYSSFTVVQRKPLWKIFLITIIVTFCLRRDCSFPSREDSDKNKP